ncbi:unnamed protein product, partial [marine sediment metagenome]
RDKIENYKVHWGDIYRFSTASDGKTPMEKHFKGTRKGFNLDFLLWPRMLD